MFKHFWTNYSKKLTTSEKKQKKMKTKNLEKSVNTSEQKFDRSRISRSQRIQSLFSQILLSLTYHLTNRRVMIKLLISISFSVKRTRSSFSVPIKFYISVTEKKVICEKGKIFLRTINFEKKTFLVSDNLNACNFSTSQCYPYFFT